MCYPKLKTKTRIQKQGSKIPEYKTIHAIADKRIPEAEKEISRQLRRDRTDVSINTMARGFEAGDTNRVFEELREFDLLEALVDTEFSMQQASLAAASEYAKHIDPDFVFDSTDPEVERRLARFELERIAQESQDAIRETIASLIDIEELSSRQKSLFIQEVAGSNRKQARAALNILRSNLEEGRAPREALRIASKAAEKFVKERTRTIAENEMMRAANVGAELAIAQAREQGLISPQAVKFWIVTPDDILCPICRPLRGQEQPIDESFTTSVGPLPAPPAHVNCRCVIGFKEPR